MNQFDTKTDKIPHRDLIGPKRGMSKRLKEVAELVSQGFSKREIAEKLDISEHTVKFHVSQIGAHIGKTGAVNVAVWWVTEGKFAL